MTKCPLIIYMNSIGSGLICIILTINGASNGDRVGAFILVQNFAHPAARAIRFYIQPLFNTALSR